MHDYFYSFYSLLSKMERSQEWWGWFLNNASLYCIVVHIVNGRSNNWAMCLKCQFLEQFAPAVKYRLLSSLSNWLILHDIKSIRKHYLLSSLCLHLLSRHCPGCPFGYFPRLSCSESANKCKTGLSADVQTVPWDWEHHLGSSPQPRTVCSVH